MHYTYPLFPQFYFCSLPAIILLNINFFITIFCFTMLLQLLLSAQALPIVPRIITMSLFTSQNVRRSSKTCKPPQLQKTWASAVWRNLCAFNIHTSSLISADSPVDFLSCDITFNVSANSSTDLELYFSISSDSFHFWRAKPLLPVRKFFGRSLAHVSHNICGQQDLFAAQLYCSAEKPR